MPDEWRWPRGDGLADAPVLAEVRSALWLDGRPEEFPLVAGKVQNLRVALPAFHAVEVPAGGVLSFWRQLGRPTARRGFVLGREVRQGCVVPTLAGGICQLSNALATAAHRAGLEMVERHGHTASIEDATAPELDATVFWRHVDLRLRAPWPWRVEISMDADELVLTIRGSVPAAKPAAIPIRREAPSSPAARGCLSCGETTCFRHGTHGAAATTRGRTLALLDAWVPEFEAWLDVEVERFVPVPTRLAFWRARPPAWAGHRFYAVSLLHVFRLGASARLGNGRRQASIVQGQRRLAQAYARSLRPEHVRLLVDQGLLPRLELLGALAGREVVVLATSLPMAEIETRLDAAAKRWPDEASLRDYRAPPDIVAAEARALARAECVVTPHGEVAQVLGARGVRVERLDWQRPATRRAPAGDACAEPRVVFAASSLARKGAREMAAALAGMPSCRVRIVGNVQGWRGRLPEPWQGDPLADASVVALPAHVEHAPRLLLRALALGLPVVATPACGLPKQPGLRLVPPGDVEALREALIDALNAARKHAELEAYIAAERNAWD